MPIVEGTSVSIPTQNFHIQLVRKVTPFTNMFRQGLSRDEVYSVLAKDITLTIRPDSILRQLSKLEKPCHITLPPCWDCAACFSRRFPFLLESHNGTSTRSHCILYMAYYTQYEAQSGLRLFRQVTYNKLHFRANFSHPLNYWEGSNLHLALTKP